MAIPPGYAALTGSEPPRPANHTFIGSVDPSEIVDVTLLLRSRPDGPPLPDLEHWRQTAPSQRRFLTPDDMRLVTALHEVTSTRWPGSRRRKG